MIDVSGADPAFTNGEQGYSVGGEGQVELNFDAVSWNPNRIQDVEVTLDVWLAEGDYLPGDSLRILADVSNGDLSETLTLFDVTGVDIEAGALIEGAWNSLQLEIANDWRSAALQIVTNTHSGLDSDTFIFDNIGIAGAAPPPPPPPPTTRRPILIRWNSFENPDVGAVEHTIQTGAEISFTRTVVGAATSGVIDGSPAGSPFTNGDQGYVVGGQGEVELNFDNIDWLGLGVKDVELTMDVWVADREFAAEESLRISVDVIGGENGELSETLLLLDLTGAEINAGDLTKGQWNSLLLEIDDVWSQAALQIVANTNDEATDQVFIFDSIALAGEGMPIPEPSALVLVIVGVLGLFCRARRRARGG